MADVELSYKGTTIGSLSSSGTLTMETAGKYCEADIELEYTAPSGQAAAIVGMAVATNQGTTYKTIGGPNNYTDSSASFTDANYFTLSDGVFTCVKAGTYYYSLSIQGSYTSAGNSCRGNYRLYKNATIVDSGQTSTINAFRVYTGSLTLTVGDNVYLQTAASTGDRCTDGVILLKTYS